MTYFSLYGCCIPVKGATNSIVCDLQRDTFIPIPLTLHYILTKYKRKSIVEIKHSFNNEHDSEIDEYFNQMVANDFGFFTNEIEKFPEIQLDQWHEPRLITNAIIDFDPNSKHDLAEIFIQLSAFFCESVELRFFFALSIEQLALYLEFVKHSSFRSVEIVVGYHTTLTLDNIVQLHQENSRLRKVTVHSSPASEFSEHLEIFVGFTQERIDSENCCGAVSPWYFVSSTQLFIEAKTYNSCLNRKISIDKKGNIKNCPSMVRSYGNINETKLNDVVMNNDFRKVWSITKDSINICRDCEFRYICQDCRAYTQDSNNMYSKPLKCRYNPYLAVWEN